MWYNRADGSAGTTRLNQIKYPHVGAGYNTFVDVNYTSQAGLAINRPDNIASAGSVLSSWKYIGLGMIASQKYDRAASSELTYGGSGTNYSGYDRFGRIIETLWKTGSTEQVHSKYGRNAVGGVLWRQDVKAAAILVTTQDNLYGYDALQQVRQHQRGQLSSFTPPTITNLQQQENLSFDETGNWTSYSSMVPLVAQTRTANLANQIASPAGPTSVIQPVYDYAGNMTTMPKPAAVTADWSVGYACVWDA